MSNFLRFALEESNEWIRGIFCFLYNFQLIFTFYPQFSFFYLLITLTDGGFMSVEVEEKVLESELSTAVESEVEQAQTKEEDKVILPFAVGACVIMNGTESVLSYAFGTVAMVAMAPLITIQLLGFRAILMKNIREKIAMNRILNADDEQIIDFM